MSPLQSAQMRVAGIIEDIEHHEILARGFELAGATHSAAVTRQLLLELRTRLAAAQAELRHIMAGGRRGD
jgi:hypothetical protein